MKTLSLKLLNFEGPIDLLPALIKTGEIEIKQLNILEILQQLISQFMISPETIDLGAESLTHGAHLLWLKSRALLPKSSIEEPGELAEESSELHLGLLEKLVEYCRFKEAARTLSEREERSSDSFSRQTSAQGEPVRPLGLAHISLEEFATLFQEVLKKASNSRGKIEEEEFKVSDKIANLRTEIKDCKKIDFNILFSSRKTKIELIVTFLALLEMMKLGEVLVIKENDTIYIMSYGERN